MKRPVRARPKKRPAVVVPTVPDAENIRQSAQWSRLVFEARAHRTENRLADAERVLRHVMHRTRRADARFLLAVALRDLAALYLDTNREKAAKEILRHAPALVEDAHPRLAAELHFQLGWVRHGSRRPNIAYKHYTRALALFADQRSPAVASCIHHLGVLQLDLDRPRAGEETLFRALGMRIELFGPTSDAVASTLFALSFAFRARGDEDGAGRLLERALFCLHRKTAPRARRLRVQVFEELCARLLASGRSRSLARLRARFDDDDV